VLGVTQWLLLWRDWWGWWAGQQPNTTQQQQQLCKTGERVCCGYVNLVFTFVHSTLLQAAAAAAAATADSM
jgi:hypothetical protein